MVWSRWYDIDEVQQILVKKKNDKLIRMFNAPLPSTVALKDITMAYQDFNLLYKSVK